MHFMRLIEADGVGKRVRVWRLGGAWSRILLALGLWVVWGAPGVGERAAAAEKQLNLLIWSEYMDPAVLADFEKAQGCKVVMDFYEEESAMSAKLRNGGANQYDVVVAPDHSIPRLAKLGLLKPLDRTVVTGITNVDPKFLNLPFDPGNQFSVPYLWGTVCLYVRPVPGREFRKSWGLLFDAKQEVGSFVMMDSMRDMIGAALKYQGASLNSTNMGELKKARDLFIGAKGRSKGFEAGVGGKNKVLARTVQVAMVYSGDALRGMQEDRETVCFIPEEGSQIWVDNLIVCKNAPHAELAWRFVEHLMDPKTAAQLANTLQYATPNAKARPWLDATVLRNPAIYPPEEVMSKLEFLRDLGSFSRTYDELWTVVKAK